MQGQIMRLGIVTDIHLSPAGTPPGKWHNPLVYDRADDLLARAIAFFEDKEIDAVAVLGDLSNFGDAESITRGVTALASFDEPVYVVAGNHDALGAIELWRSTIESHATGQVSIPTGDRNGSSSIRLAGIGDIHGTAAEDQWHIPAGSVELTAPDDQPLVLLVHFPLVIREAEINAAGFKFAGAFHWDETGEQLMARSAPTIVLHGHLHVRHTTVEGSILQLGFASLIEPPHAVGLVDIEDIDGTITVHVEHHDIDTHDVEFLPVLSESEETWTFRDGEWSAVTP
jgi:predicted phosphodiesterase